MPYNVYKALHLLGLLLLFTGLGAQVGLGARGSGEAEPGLRRHASVLHGLGLLLMLVAGFGLLARMPGGIPLWAWLKLLVWIGLGSAFVLVRKLKEAPALLLWLFPALGAVAALLALFKPTL